MQTVTNAFTAEERDRFRGIAANLKVSWKKDSTLGSRTFTIGVSTIGGNDIIGINPGAIGSPGIYRYFDESDYLQSLAWERGLNMPTGGLAKGYAEAVLDNTSGRFTPRYMGGQSELYTAIQPRKPFIINAGFKISSSNVMIPQFSGVLDRQPNVNQRSRDIRLHGSDYLDFFKDRFLDQEVMFTSQRTDQVMTTLFSSLGVSTAQYDIDYGINLIPFGLFNRGTKYQDIFHQLAEAENGHFYQDESGIFKFENRQHWDSAPYTQVQRVIYTAQVLEAEAPDEDHLVNVVEVKGSTRAKQPLQVIMNFNTSTQINPNSTVDLFFSYDDPVLAVTSPTSGGSDSYYEANLQSDGSGTDMTSSVSVKSIDNFAMASKVRFQNNSSNTVYLTKVVISGRPAKKISDIYLREQDDSSVTAYDEHVLSIDNEYIQNPSWAASYARTVLDDFSNIENLQRITILAIPEIQLGDLVSWQGRYWRVFDIKSTLRPDVGFVQELTLLQRTITSYFRIGISTIGGSDKIAP